MSAASIELAGLEERRRGAVSSSERLDRMVEGLEQRVRQLEQMIASGDAEQKQRVIEQERLQVRSQELEDNAHDRAATGRRVGAAVGGASPAGG